MYSDQKRAAHGEEGKSLSDSVPLQAEARRQVEEQARHDPVVIALHRRRVEACNQLTEEHKHRNEREIIRSSYQNVAR